MTMKPMSPVRIALLAIAVLYAATAQAGEEAPYPLWWTPVLGLENLGDIKWKLQERFPLSRRYEVVTFDLKRVYTDTLIDQNHPEWGYNWDTETIILERRTIDNCESLIKWREQGFNIESESPYLYHGREMDAFYSGYCYALSALTSATAAKQSFLSSFVFDENALRYLPPMIGIGWDGRSLREFLQANREGVSWQDFDFGWFEDQRPRYEVTVKDKNTITVVDIRGPYGVNPESIHRAVLITIYGRGDFNGDGIDDLLIRSENITSSMTNDPKISSSSLYVVTRKKGDTVLRVVDYLGPPPYGSSSRHSSRNIIIESGQDQ